MIKKELEARYEEPLPKMESPIQEPENNVDLIIHEMFAKLMESYNMGMVSFEDMEKRLTVE